MIYMYIGTNLIDKTVLLPNPPKKIIATKL